ASDPWPWPVSCVHPTPNQRLTYFARLFAAGKGQRGGGPAASGCATFPVSTRCPPDLMEASMPKIHYGLIAALLLAGTSIAAAQQEKTQQNSADEALTRSAPEAKDQPQAP